MNEGDGPQDKVTTTKKVTRKYEKSYEEKIMD